MSDETSEIYQYVWFQKFEFGQEFTISDVWSAAEGVFHFPGNAILYGMSQVEVISSFFEMHPGLLYTNLSGFISFFSWLIILYVAVSIIDALN